MPIQRLLRRAATPLVAMAILLAGGAIRFAAAANSPIASATSVSPNPAAAAPTAGASPTDARLDGKSVIAFLGQAIAWYRGVGAESTIAREPAELLFASRNRQQADEAIKLAFDYARAAATAIGEEPRPAEKRLAAPAENVLSDPAEIAKRLAAAQADVQRYQAEEKALKTQLAAAPRIKKPSIQADLDTAQRELELASARADFLRSMSAFVEHDEGSASDSAAPAEDTLSGQIAELELSVGKPSESAQNIPQSQAPTVLEHPELQGLADRARLYMATQGRIDAIVQRERATARLADSASQALVAARAAVTRLAAQARALAAEADAPNATPAAIQQKRIEFETLLARLKATAQAMLPLDKFSLIVTRYQDSLVQWHREVGDQGTSQLYGLIETAAILTVALILIVALAIGWRRLVYRYLDDSRRRSQMLTFRNVVITVLTALVLAIPFMSELGNLGTIIGLGAAGIAVALQDVILSIAGYFRISGRYGIRVRDRLELQGVRGEVIDVGFTKLTLMELSSDGSGAPTGRMAVIPNSAVFRNNFSNRAYGSGLAWDELRFTLSPNSDYKLAEKRLKEVVDEVFSRYRESARRESIEMEQRFHLNMGATRPISQLRVSSDGIRMSVRYPVDARRRAEVADEISRRLLDSLKREPTLRLVQELPRIISLGDSEGASAVASDDSGSSAREGEGTKATGAAAKASEPKEGQA